MSVRTNIGRIRLALGMAALVGCILGMWFSLLFKPVIYSAVVCLFALWIGLWPFGVPKLGSRVFVACLGSVGVCIVLAIICEVIAYVRHDGQEELGPILFVPAFMVGMGLPITVLAAAVAAIAPFIRIRV
ncbi:MAG: hypothetical protein JOY99_07655 [Sphingomonadaceae bacterium]|nr:hypothetical protein [Sphingomonadaceae bacterium]